jgi:hypothetical protein
MQVPASAIIGEGQHAAQHPAVKRLALVGVGRIAHAEHAADVQHLDDVAGLHALRYMSRVAEQGLAMTERADDHIALAHLGHAATGEFQRVVVGLVGQHFDDHDHAFLGRNIRRDAHFARQAAGLSDGGNLVDDDTSHWGGLLGTAWGSGALAGAPVEHTGQ